MSLISYYFLGSRGSGGHICLCGETGQYVSGLCVWSSKHIFFSGNYTTLAASPLGLGEFLWSLWVTGFLTGSDSNTDWMFLAWIHWWLPGAEMAFQNPCAHLVFLCLCTSLLQSLHLPQTYRTQIPKTNDTDGL